MSYHENRESGNSLKKVLLTVVSIAAAVTVLCIFQYVVHFYFNPVREEVSLTRNGCLLLQTAPNAYESVSVTINGTDLHYPFRNKEDVLQDVDISLKGHSILNLNSDSAHASGFSLMFLQGPDYACLESINTPADTGSTLLLLSRDWNTVICGFTAGSAQSNLLAPEASAPALLIIPADSSDDARKLLREVSSHSEQLSQWLTDNSWSLRP